MRTIFGLSLALFAALIAFGCTDDNNSTIRGTDLEISTQSLPDAVEGTPYTLTLAAIGQLGPFVWSVDAEGLATLPPAMTLDSGTGVISGTPALGSAGIYPITFLSHAANGATDTKTLTLTVIAELALAPQNLPQALSGEPYTTTVTSAGGGLTKTWAVAATSIDVLPSGLSLNAASGAISGTPAFGSERTYSITLVVSDGVSAKSALFTLVVATGPVKVTTSALPNATELAPYNASLVAKGGSGNYTWSVSPTSASQLPAGFTLDPLTGAVSGTSGPQSTGTVNITFIVDDGVTTHEMVVTFTIVPGPLSIFSTSLSAGQEGEIFSDQLIASGGTESFAWSIATTSAEPLPSGLSLASDGTISGTPAFDTEGNHAITFEVTDGATQLQTTLTIAIGALDASALLDTLIANGGGQGGGTLDANDRMAIRVFSRDTNAVVNGFEVMLSDTNGVELIRGATNATGDLSFDISALPSVPAMVTYFDSTRKSLFTRTASTNMPLAQVQAYVYGNTQGLTVTLTQSQANKDLVVTLNGEFVYAVDNVGINETFTISDQAGFTPNKPWLLVAHLYENDVIGEVDTQTLTTAAYIADSLGEGLMAAPRAVTVNLDSGAGTTLGSITSGQCGIASLSGSVTPPTLGAGLTTFAWVYAEIQNAFGSATYNRRAITPNVVTSNFDYQIQFPTFPGLPSADFTESHRQAVLPVGAVATVGQVPNNLALLRDLPKLVRRTVAAGLGVTNFNFGTLPTIGLSTIFADLSTPTRSNATLTSAAASLRLELDAGTSILTSAHGNNGALNFPMLAAQIGTLTFSGVRVAFDAPEDASFDFNDGSRVWRSPANAATLLSALIGNGNIGTPSARVAIAGGSHPVGALDAVLAAPLAASFSAATDSIVVNTSGLGARLGTWNLKLSGPAGAAFARTWFLEADTRATQAGGEITFRMPTLPVAWNASFQGVSVTPALWFRDQTASGVDRMASTTNALPLPNPLTAGLGADSFALYAYRTLGSDLLGAFSVVPAFWRMELGGMASFAVNP